MKKEIRRRESHAQPALQASALHPLLKRIYASRQVGSLAEIETHLDRLIPFQSLLNIDDAIAVLVEAVTQNLPITIVGDFDADGATSTAIAVRALRSFGAQHVNYLVPNRFAFGYGLTPELVEVAKGMKPALIVTVDNGIANHAGVEAAVAAGIKVVITDHHLAAATLPPAHAIVNPNQPGDEFPSKNLAGCGVIFYVMLALRRALHEQDWFTRNNLPEPNMSRLLDLVALGTVADLVQLDQNNRILVQQGLRRIRAGQCIPGIVALLELAGRDFAKAQASDLGFAVAARLNAAGRLDDMSLGIECLLSDDAAGARTIARTLHQLNKERRLIEKDMQSQALVALEKLSLQFNNELPKGLCLYDANWHQGVIGILASRIKDKFNRPVIVFAPGPHGELKGSARSIAGLHIRDVLALIDTQYPGMMIKFGGHAMAAGLSLQQERLVEFTDAFVAVINEQLSEDQLKHCIYSDGELTTDELSLESATALRDGGPWGQAFPEPQFDGVFNVLEQRLVGDKHLKLTLAKDDKLIDAIAFFVDTKQWPNHRCQQVNLAYRLDINEYRDRRNVQLIVDYLEEILC
jgi:single-stranded-DNA-specific exonuclease